MSSARDFTPTAKLVYKHLYSHAGPEGTVKISQRKLSEELDVPLVSICRATRSLVAHGMLNKIGYNNCTYKLCGE